MYFSPALILSIGTFLSYFLGILRDIVFANYYGANELTDAYFSAFLIPDFLLMIFISSALLGLVTPLFLEEKEKNKQKGYKLFGLFFLVLNLVFIFVSLFGVVFTKELFQFIYPTQYSITPIELVFFGKLFFISNIFFALSNFIGNFLMAHNFFISVAISPLVYNLGILIGIIFLSDTHGIYGAGYGAVVGAILHFLVRIYEYFYIKYKFIISYDLNSIHLKILVKSMIFRWVTSAMFPLMFFIINFFASFGQSGLYTLFLYARNLESAPIAIFGVSIATALFPLLSKKMAEKKYEDFVSIFWKGFYKILFWTIPFVVGIGFIGGKFLSYIYGLNSDFKEYESLIYIITILSFTIPFEALSSLFARTFNALKNTKIPMINSIFFLLMLITTLTFFYLTEIFTLKIYIPLAYLLAFFTSLLINFYYLFKIDCFKNSSFFKNSFEFKGVIISIYSSSIMFIFLYILSFYKFNTFIEIFLIPLASFVLYLLCISSFWRKNTFFNIKKML
jgi:putative peptidoglycan lipid II flippase